MKKIIARAITTCAPLLMAAGCDVQQTSSDKQRDLQERILAEGTSQTGMPSIKNFRERKLLKDIFELRDQDGLVTYTYLYNEMQGKLVFVCDSFGYGIPYATQYTAPESVQRWSLHSSADRQAAWGQEKMPQADPNGLFSPSSATGTWVMCKDPAGKDVRPVYIEPNVVVSPFKLP